jgi:hypothetical protein
MFPKARSLPHPFCSRENGRPERGRPVVELAGVAQRSASPVAEGSRCQRATCVSSMRVRMIRRSKQQRACLLATPGFETALKRSQKLVRVRARMFRLQLRQELRAGSPRLGPEPVQQLRVRLNERIKATTTSLRFEDRPGPSVERSPLSRPFASWRGTSRSAGPQ